MAKNDWAALQKQFERDHERYGTSAKDWCDKKGLNYQTARRHIKVRKIAQNDSAQSAQKGKPRGKNAQTAQGRKNSDKKKSSTKNLQKNKSDSPNSTPTDPKDRNMAERDAAGRFKPGHSLSVGNSGNPEPSCSFEPGNQLRRKGGIYARYFPESKQAMFDFSECATLEDELILTRTRLQAGIEYLGKISEDLQNATAMEEKISLYDSYQKTENRIDVLTARIESITKTLSNLGIDVVTREKIVQDTKRIKNASRKLGLEADELQNKGKADDTPISDIVAEIQSMGKSGLMSES
ncbi:hypothetical protein DI392_00760 [Vibrio albus]|uniref:Terminase n=1 Tax=Vibrio albus TaxID=2200953 RepID=A0A2U3BDN2_9VIBR|nr:hypothetical protein [Vibrio albus]PWI34844.1 hypothetical protein DI392_00760 [Vibrio albus]